MRFDTFSKIFVKSRLPWELIQMCFDYHKRAILMVKIRRARQMTYSCSMFVSKTEFIEKTQNMIKPKFKGPSNGFGEVYMSINVFHTTSFPKLDKGKSYYLVFTGPLCFVFTPNNVDGSLYQIVLQKCDHRYWLFGVLNGHCQYIEKALKLLYLERQI